MTATACPAERSGTPPAGGARQARGSAKVFLLCLPTDSSDPYGTSGHLGFSADWSLVQHQSTSWVALAVPAPRTVPNEVRELRDRIIGVTGLSRQEIARSIGVDRRSLSGYVSGEIRPTDDRLRLLRELADIAEWSAERFGDHARELLRGTSHGRPILDLIGEPGGDIRRTLAAIAHASGFGRSPTIRIEARPARPSLHRHALSVWSGDSSLPERGGTPRAGTVYEQDLSTAPQAPEPRVRPRRRRIR